MTDQEIAQALERMIREDAERPPEEQIRDLIEAGVIDDKGRVLIGFWNKHAPPQSPAPQNSPGTVSGARSEVQDAGRRAP